MVSIKKKERRRRMNEALIKLMADMYLSINVVTTL
jgi:hypothetical protein